MRAKYCDHLETNLSKLTELDVEDLLQCQYTNIAIDHNGTEIFSTEGHSTQARFDKPRVRQHPTWGGLEVSFWASILLKDEGEDDEDGDDESEEGPEGVEQETEVAVEEEAEEEEDVEGDGEEDRVLLSDLREDGE